MRGWFMSGLVCAGFLAGCGEATQAPPAGERAASAPAASPHGDPMFAPHGGGGQDVSFEPGPFDVGGINLTAPEGWVRKQPSSGFVLAEFGLPAAEGDEADGRLTVSTAGGSVDANIDRWRGQFGGQPEEERRDEIEAGGLKVTIVDFSGEYSDQPGPFAPAEKRPNYRMLAAIVPVQNELYFIKGYGPKATMAAQAETFHQFVQSVAVK